MSRNRLVGSAFTVLGALQRPRSALAGSAWSRARFPSVGSRLNASSKAPHDRNDNPKETKEPETKPQQQQLHKSPELEAAKSPPNTWQQYQHVSERPHSSPSSLHSHFSRHAQQLMSKNGGKTPSNATTGGGSGGSAVGGKAGDRSDGSVKLEPPSSTTSPPLAQTNVEAKTDNPVSGKSFDGEKNKKHESDKVSEHPQSSRGTEQRKTNPNQIHIQHVLEPATKRDSEEIKHEKRSDKKEINPNFETKQKENTALSNDQKQIKVHEIPKPPASHGETEKKILSSNQTAIQAQDTPILKKDKEVNEHKTRLTNEEIKLLYGNKRNQGESSSTTIEKETHKLKESCNENTHNSKENNTEYLGEERSKSSILESKKNVGICGKYATDPPITTPLLSAGKENTGICATENKETNASDKLGNKEQYDPCRIEKKHVKGPSENMNNEDPCINYRKDAPQGNFQGDNKRTERDLFTGKKETNGCVEKKNITSPCTKKGKEWEPMKRKNKEEMELVKTICKDDRNETKRGKREKHVNNNSESLCKIENKKEAWSLKSIDESCKPNKENRKKSKKPETESACDELCKLETETRKKVDPCPIEKKENKEPRKTKDPCKLEGMRDKSPSKNKNSGSNCASYKKNANPCSAEKKAGHDKSKSCKLETTNGSGSSSNTVNFCEPKKKIRLSESLCKELCIYSTTTERKGESKYQNNPCKIGNIKRTDAWKMKKKVKYLSDGNKKERKDICKRNEKIEPKTDCFKAPPKTMLSSEIRSQDVHESSPCGKRSQPWQCPKSVKRKLVKCVCCKVRNFFRLRRKAPKNISNEKCKELKKRRDLRSSSDIARETSNSLCAQKTKESKTPTDMKRKSSKYINIGKKKPSPSVSEQNSSTSPCAPKRIPYIYLFVCGMVRKSNSFSCGTKSTLVKYKFDAQRELYKYSFDSIRKYSNQPFSLTQISSKSVFDSERKSSISSCSSKLMPFDSPCDLKKKSSETKCDSFKEKQKTSKSPFHQNKKSSSIPCGQKEGLSTSSCGSVLGRSKSSSRVKRKSSMSPSVPKKKKKVSCGLRKEPSKLSCEPVLGRPKSSKKKRGSFKSPCDLKKPPKPPCDSVLGRPKSSCKEKRELFKSPCDLKKTSKASCESVLGRPKSGKKRKSSKSPCDLTQSSKISCGLRKEHSVSLCGFMLRPSKSSVSVKRKSSKSPCSLKKPPSIPCGLRKPRSTTICGSVLKPSKSLLNTRRNPSKSPCNLLRKSRSDWRNLTVHPCQLRIEAKRAVSYESTITCSKRKLKCININELLSQTKRKQMFPFAIQKARISENTIKRLQSLCNIKNKKSNESEPKESKSSCWPAKESKSSNGGKTIESSKSENGPTKETTPVMQQKSFGLLWPLFDITDSAGQPFSTCCKSPPGKYSDCRMNPGDKTPPPCKPKKNHWSKLIWLTPLALLGLLYYMIFGRKRPVAAIKPVCKEKDPNEKEKECPSPSCSTIEKCTRDAGPFPDSGSSSDNGSSFSQPPSSGLNFTHSPYKDRCVRCGSPVRAKDNYSNGEISKPIGSHSTSGLSRPRTSRARAQRSSDRIDTYYTYDSNGNRKLRDIPSRSGYFTPSEGDSKGNIHDHNGKPSDQTRSSEVLCRPRSSHRSPENRQRHLYRRYSDGDVPK